MVKRIVAWNLKEGLTDGEKREQAEKIKAEIEALVDKIDGVLELKVEIEPLPSSTRDIMLSGLFASPEALEAYIVHPEHQRVAAFVGGLVQDRACFAYYA